MHILLAVCSLLCALAAAFFMWRCSFCLEECEKHARRLATMRGLVTGNTAAVDSLTLQLQKLRGQHFALKALVDDGPPPYTPPVSVDTAAPQAEFCANYGQAQSDGPLSAAAACECGYCVEMRERREAFRRSAVPRTATGQAKLARLNAGKSDGE